MAAREAMPVGIDPLIAEAKQRARRRYLLLALGAVVIVGAAAAVGTRYELRSSANYLGVCATPPSGFQERTLRMHKESDGAVAPAAVVLTNFRFGRMDYLYGLTGRRHWPVNGVTVAVINEGRASPGGFGAGGALRLTRGSFGGMEGALHPAGQAVAQSNSRVLNAFVEVGALTPATIAAANKALAGVRVCSA